MPRIKLTATTVEQALTTEGVQLIVRDTELRGFALRVTSSRRNEQTKTFIVEKRVLGQNRRMAIGKYPELTVAQARREAQALLGQMATGVDPLARKREAMSKQVTLGEAWIAFQGCRDLKDHTLYDYRRIMERNFGDWLKRPWIEITGDLAIARHKKLSASAGPHYANLAMRVLRSVMNYAIATYRDKKGAPLVVENPVTRLRAAKAWNKTPRRTNYIQPHQLPGLWDALHQLDNKVARDYLLLVLLTGLRRREAERLRVEDIDLKGRSLTIRDTKNGYPLPLPLSDFVHEVVARGVEASKTGFLFPATFGDGHIVEVRRQIAKVKEVSGLKFTIHDLRRTFATIAESLDIPAYALKALLNHRTNGGDVTGGYIQISVERLRVPMQRITDYVLSASKGQSKVVSITRGAS